MYTKNIHATLIITILLLMTAGCTNQSQTEIINPEKETTTTTSTTTTTTTTSTTTTIATIKTTSTTTTTTTTTTSPKGPKKVEYEEIGTLAEINGELAYIAEKEGKTFIVYQDQEERKFDKILNERNITNPIANNCMWLHWLFDYCFGDI